MNEIEAKIIFSQNELLEANIISAYDIKGDIWKWLTLKKEGYFLPWSSWSNDFQLIKGEMTVISGYTGHGKSQFVNQLALHCVHQGARVFISSFELSPGNLYGRLLKQATGVKDPTYEYLGEFIKFYDRKIFAYDLMGEANIDEVLVSTEKAHEICSIDFFIFDNLMMLNAAVDKFDVQHNIVQKLLRFAKDRNVCVILVAHSKKPLKGMAIPTMYDVSGSSNIVNMVDNHLSVSKNLSKIRAIQKISKNEILTKEEEEALKFGDAIIMRDKKRETGNNFFKSLYFDEKFDVFKEYESQIVKPYFEYPPIKLKDEKNEVQKLS